MIDTDPVPAGITCNPPKSGTFKVCGTTTIHGNRGISVDWADTYRFSLGASTSYWTAETASLRSRRDST
jgi:hypothetical protein